MNPFWAMEEETQDLYEIAEAIFNGQKNDYSEEFTDLVEMHVGGSDLLVLDRAELTDPWRGFEHCLIPSPRVGVLHPLARSPGTAAPRRRSTCYCPTSTTPPSPGRWSTSPLSPAERTGQPSCSTPALPGGPSIEPIALGCSGSVKRAVATTEAALESLTTPGAALVKVADKLLTTIAHAFGDSESWYTTATGVLVRDQRTTFLPGGPLYEWAKRNSIEVVDRQATR
ncbi:hypothetical protein ACFRAR_30655 [Kitasatospora sp. NPDC056651]|uniref:hypothetical protein n=1 Tax=Kitasatospora sp. NPDC056651 TaxID=3345892 RepID=UPI0036CFE922